LTKVKLTNPNTPSEIAHSQRLVASGFMSRRS